MVTRLAQSLGKRLEQVLMEWIGMGPMTGRTKRDAALPSACGGRGIRNFDLCVACGEEPSLAASEPATVAGSLASACLGVQGEAAPKILMPDTLNPGLASQGAQIATTPIRGKAKGRRLHKDGQDDSDDDDRCLNGHRKTNRSKRRQVRATARHVPAHALHGCTPCSRGDTCTCHLCNFRCRCRSRIRSSHLDRISDGTRAHSDQVNSAAASGAVTEEMVGVVMAAAREAATAAAATV
eukprot:scaffold224563_cov31-Tisochrysis_lutea.AAC.1